MNDIKDILNKIKFVPEDMQDEVFKNIKKCVEKEIIKSCNPIDLLIQKLEELEFGKNEDNEQDRRIIKTIVSCLEDDWFYMRPIYCKSVEKEKKVSDDYTRKYKVNKGFDDFIDKEIKEKDDDQIYWVIREVAQQCNAENIDCIKDSYWIYKDGANWETWIFTTKGLANEMLYWIRDCFFSSNHEDVEVCYKILNKIEKYYSKKE